MLSGCGKENGNVKKFSKNSLSIETEKIKSTVNNKKTESIVENCIKGSSVCSVTVLSKGITAIITEDKEHIITCNFIDMNANKVLGELSELGFDRNMTVEMYDKGCVIYTSMGQIYVLDEEYKIQNKVDASKYVSYSEQRNYVINPLAKKIIVCIEKEGRVFQEVVSMDYDGKNKNILYRVFNPDGIHNEVNQIVEMKLARNQKYIFINGLYYENAQSGEEAKVCIGTISLEDGSNYIYKDELSFFTVFEDKAIYYEGMADYKKESSGKVKLIYGNNKSKDIEFDEKWKSQVIYFSDNGNYILTYGDDEIGASKTMISIYNLRTNKKVKDVEFKNKLYDVAVCEKKSVIYGFFYGDDGETNVEIKGY